MILTAHKVLLLNLFFLLLFDERVTDLVFKLITKI